MSYDQELIAAKLRRWDKFLRGYTLPTWEELPELELYMDQVIALLSHYLDFLPREDSQGQVVTASAINNYVRTRVMPAPHKKRYSRLHLAYLVMICTLKQGVSISYVQKLLPLEMSREQVRLIYDDFVRRHQQTSLYFIEQVRQLARPVLDHTDSSDNAVPNLVAATAITSSLARLLTEKLIDLQGQTLRDFQLSEVGD